MAEQRRTGRAQIDILLNKYVGGVPYTARARDISPGGVRLARLLEPVSRAQRSIRLPQGRELDGGSLAEFKRQREQVDSLMAQSCASASLSQTSSSASVSPALAVTRSSSSRTPWCVGAIRIPPSSPARASST